ncbi:MAG TPA: inositol monophosphatase [Stellaceae bacterium]|nr:inositol monophosphatase [Stellaceae bacterium]
MPDLDRVARIIRDTAATEILPRFRALGAGDISEKKPGDLVTIADVESERSLTRGLVALEPGTAAIGEEGVHADPTRLQLLGEDAPVWVIDPIDGTGNFAKGVPRFAVIIAYVVRGVTEAGWIYDPLSDAMVMAVRGGGAWCDGRRLRVVAETRQSSLAGSAYGRTPAGVRAAVALEASGRVGAVRNRGCSGLEYMELARGEAHFTLHSRSLVWDHAAGMLIAAEAGGVATFLDGSPYDPRISDKRPLAAASAETWSLIASIVTAPAP